MPNGPKIRGPLLLVATGLAFALAFTLGYTTWALHYHDQQACAALQIQATATGASSPYDRTIREQYRRLYALRCG